MQRFQKGNFDSKIKKIHQDELGYLDSSFNEMVEQMNTLIQKVYQANIDIKEAQLRALQAQINPHFLYNSLSIINRLSDLGCNQEINQMVFSLATFYRMTLNKGKDIIRIEDEIKQIKAYLDIYKIRLEDRFEVAFDFDPQILHCETVKVILQPFVENIFEHALGESEDTIHIRITGKCMPPENDIQNDFIQFTIQDDGIGIEPERLSELIYTDSQNTSGYGIKNVHQRIQIHYGPDYGVRICSELGEGTTVKINIPYKDS